MENPGEYLRKAQRYCYLMLKENLQEPIIIARRAYCVGVQKSLFVSVSVRPSCLSEVRFGHDFERFRAGKRRFRGQKTVKKWLFLGF